MNLATPLNLILLVICLVMGYLLVHRRRRYLKRFQNYAETSFHRYYHREQSAFWVGLKLVMGIIALAAIILALVRPQWDYETRELEKKGMDIVFAIDVSRSMDAQDVMPSRLMRALIQISAFLEQLDTDRIGIIAFAGVATLECPLTDDFEAVRIVLQGLNSNTGERPGTNIGSALSLAAQAFSQASAANSIVLISDGEDLSGEAMKQAKLLKDKGIRLYTMGVGSPEGTIVENPYTGQEVVSKLDEASLQKLADSTGGEYFRITPGGDEIQLVLRRIYEREEGRINRKSISSMKEQYYLFALLALLILLGESLIDPRKRTKGLLAAEHQDEA